jgi:hypothetical protein
MLVENASHISQPLLCKKCKKHVALVEVIDCYKYHTKHYTVCPICGGKNSFGKLEETKILYPYRVSELHILE